MEKHKPLPPVKHEREYELHELFREAVEEVNMRYRVYGYRVQEKKMELALAKRKIAKMEQIRENLYRQVKREERSLFTTTPEQQEIDRLNAENYHLKKLLKEAGISYE